MGEFNINLQSLFGKHLYNCNLFNIWGIYMKKKAKYFMEAVIVTVIAIAFIMPGTAVLTEEDTNNGLPEGANVQTIVEEKQDTLLKDTPQTLNAANDIWVTPFVGDDYIPAITVDGSNNVVIVWTNEETFTTSYQGISYSNNPADEATWQENGVVFDWTMENPWGWDIGYMTGDHYTGLGGCAYDFAESAQIGFQIDDITDLENTLQAWTWSGESPELVSCETVDQPNFNGVHYPDVIGWADAMVFHFEGMGYDIPGCPVFFRTDPVALGGLSFFDAQENEDTAPANAYDFFVETPNKVHHVMSNLETGKIIWKMTIQDEESDIEYTPYQATIADGAYGQMAGNAENVVITFIDGGSVNAISSSDDGESWQTTTIGDGNYANICEANGVFYCVYTNDNNLYLSSSEDGGATWSDGTQVNDVDGTVVDEHKYFDVHKGGIVWTDDRNEDWDVYYQPLETGPAPFLVIEDIAGGLGVSANIKNIGDADATNIQWTISAEGTVFVGGEKTGNIGSLAPGGSAAISSFLLGFGGVEIDFSAVSDEGASASASASGNLLLFFLAGIE